MAAPTFAEFVAGGWQADCYASCKPSTQRRVDGLLRTQLLPQFGPTALDEIQPKQVHVWFDLYSCTAPGGANRALDVLRQILNHAVALGFLPRNPAASVRPNPRPRPTRFLSRPEIDRLYAALRSHHGRGSGRQQCDIIRLLLLTGCRKGELISLRWSEADDDVLHLGDSKTGPRTVFLNTPARAILMRQPRVGPYVFPAPNNPSAPRSSELSVWRKVRRSASLDGVRLHDLRHTFASHAVISGVPIPVVARLLGHSHVRMTLRYVHVSDRETENAAERVGAAIALLLHTVDDVPTRHTNSSRTHAGAAAARPRCQNRTCARN